MACSMQHLDARFLERLAWRSTRRISFWARLVMAMGVTEVEMQSHVTVPQRQPKDGTRFLGQPAILRVAAMYAWLQSFPHVKGMQLYGDPRHRRRPASEHRPGDAG
jgi:hypothetical protein